jgi:hypothetical protein
LCIDCEFPNPWGRVGSAVDTPLLVWLAVAPFLAGLFALKKGWLVPVSMVLALLVTQPLGGVLWWSLRDNEGPFILVFGLPATAACSPSAIWLARPWPYEGHHWLCFVSARRPAAMPAAAPSPTVLQETLSAAIDTVRPFCSPGL